MTPDRERGAHLPLDGQLARDYRHHPSAASGGPVIETRWWKTDLQVASPGARNFRGPSDQPWDIQTQAGRRAAADRYMQAAAAAGVEVVALADHNDASWIAPMVEAGEAAGVVVLPGVEITTGSGADGVHLIVIGAPSCTKDDFDQILNAACGFGPDHPRFDPVSGNPASSPRTAIQILDDLPEGYLVVAPHAFNDNGIASMQTVRGDLRWKLLHHDRLGAIDVGDVRTLEPGSWHQRFAERDLNDFPCLEWLAFVSTSDTYELGRLGARWSWIRMSSPTIEGLRQAFLDPVARIVCDWDTRFPGGLSPNDVSHAWIRQIELEGLATSTDRVSVAFDPRLNVLIGGRGSGKSTVVAGIRCLYGDIETLPTQAREEAAELRRSVFSNAQVTGTHHLAYSGESQIAEWTQAGGSVTRRPDDAAVAGTSTDFKVQVINQKELFERAAHSSGDPHSTSRNLLQMVDDALATGSRGPGGPAAFAAALAEAQTTWLGAAREYQSEVEATSQRDVVAARVGELSRQVAAFDSEESKARRERNDRFVTEQDELDSISDAVESVIDQLHADIANPHIPTTESAPASGAEEADVAVRYQQVTRDVAAVAEALRTAVGQAVDEARGALAEARASANDGAWGEALREALADAERYRAELAELGVDPDEYIRLRETLSAQRRLLDELDARRSRLAELDQAARDAWSRVAQLLDERRLARTQLLDEVAERSGMLRFVVCPHADVGAWVTGVRDLLNLRADGFLADVPSLAQWLWAAADATEADRRAEIWRRACITGDFQRVAVEAQLRPAWAERLTALDEIVRARLGSTVANDVVEMQFLTEGGDPTQEADWKPLTAGSPGQRSAAMLSFVLHHGVDPLVLDQPEDDLDTEWITDLVVRQLRISRWLRQLIVITHNANIPVNADAERVIVMENHAGGIRVRKTTGDGESEIEHAGALEEQRVRQDVQRIMEGGVQAFVRRERRYNNELNTYRSTLRALTGNAD